MAIDDDGWMPPDSEDAYGEVVPIGRAKRKGKKQSPPLVHDGWEAMLLRDDDGKPVRGLANVITVLAEHPKWIGVLAYDAFGERIAKLRVPPTRPQDGVAELGEWTESDSTRTAAWFAQVVGFEPAPVSVEQAVRAAAERCTIHPVREYLAALTWDCEPRLDSMLCAYFGADDTEYTRAVGSRWMISAVARVMCPGCQADACLVLECKQGVRKSTALEALTSRAWFGDTKLDLSNKDCYQSLRSKWIYELGELDSIKGREVTRVKAFLSARSDNYRPSYGRRNQDFPRQCVFVGTTNEKTYLTDRTGNRRFWPVRLRGAEVSVEAIRRDRDQLWAEAYTRYQAGERWYLDTPELCALATEEQADRVPEHPWTESVKVWLDRQIAKGSIDPTVGPTTGELLSGAVDVPKERQDERLSTVMGTVMVSLGWESYRPAKDVTGARTRRYRRMRTA